MYVPGESPVIIVLEPVPLVMDAPGVLIKVQVPVAGNPFKVTLPVATVQVGCIIVPTVGAVGADNRGLIIILADDTDVHPEALVTV